jgi:hypothetical protein
MVGVEVGLGVTVAVGVGVAVAVGEGVSVNVGVAVVGACVAVKITAATGSTAHPAITPAHTIINTIRHQKFIADIRPTERGEYPLFMLLPVDVCCNLMIGPK